MFVSGDWRMGSRASDDEGVWVEAGAIAIGVTM